MSDNANQAAWSSVVSGLIFNPETAICKKWLDLKSEGTYIGVPVSDELKEDDGSTRMAFSSGCVIAWDDVNGATLA
jgi:uncharacterized protein with LGFP repeats